MPLWVALRFLLIFCLTSSSLLGNIRPAQVDPAFQAEALNLPSFFSLNNLSGFPRARKVITDFIKGRPVDVLSQIKGSADRIEGIVNAPDPSLGPRVEAMIKKLKTDPSIQKKIKKDRALKILRIQILNQLKHVSFSFTRRDVNYTHADVLQGPYPRLPTLHALRKAEEFLSIAAQETVKPFNAWPEDKAKEEELIQVQKAFAAKVTSDSLVMYEGMRNRLIELGPEAPFREELGPIVQYLELKLNSDPVVITLCQKDPSMARFRLITLDYLHGVMNPPDGKDPYPYLSTIEAIQRAIEFYDVVQRTEDPERSPKLYHSDRYEYYGHYLKGQIPDNIILPTLVSLSATDILNVRGVPISFAGVTTEVMWVDGFYQTSFEFWIHDINHSRRMFQFFKEKAEALGISILEFARQSNHFVKNAIMPLIAIRNSFSDDVKNRRRLLKMLFYEIFHEDALAAAPDIMKAGVLRPPKMITPFEQMDGLVVSYVMEPGATTLAYVFRKLAHTFYDRPNARMDKIVDPAYRTRAYIVEIAAALFEAFGFQVNLQTLKYYVSTDEGLPSLFRQTIVDDVNARPNETIPLDLEQEVMDPTNIRITIAEQFHAIWQSNSGYFERWKPAHAILKDGRGIDDRFVIHTPEQLDAYLVERQIPESLRSYFSLRTNLKTGRVMLYEDIQHLPHEFLAPNNQYENLSGASVAADIVERIHDNHLEFSDVVPTMDWLKAVCQEMNLAWLRRNANWAKGDPDYDRPWSDLSAGKQQNGINLLKIALEAEIRANPDFIAPTQHALLTEAFRRVELEIAKRRAQEVMDAMTGQSIHANWQQHSGYTERWKPTNAKLLDGTPVTTDATLQTYFAERVIPAALQRYFEIRSVRGSASPVLYEDLQNLPDSYLAQNHQEENLKSGAKALDIINRIWEHHLKFKTEDDVERWLTSASQDIHKAVLERSANGAKNNPIYNQHWLNLPPVNKANDLALLRIAFETRSRLSPDGMEESQQRLISAAIDRLSNKIIHGEPLHSIPRHVKIRRSPVNPASWIQWFRKKRLNSRLAAASA